MRGNGKGNGKLITVHACFTSAALACTATPRSGSALSTQRAPLPARTVSNSDLGDGYLSFPPL